MFQINCKLKSSRSVMQLEINIKIRDTTSIRFGHYFTPPYWREQKSFLKFTTLVFKIYIILNKKPNDILGNKGIHLCILDYLDRQPHKNEDILF